MVDVDLTIERWVVDPVVAGLIPVAHPKRYCSVAQR